jgi:hypothetical protein
VPGQRPPPPGPAPRSTLHPARPPSRCGSAAQRRPRRRPCDRTHRPSDGDRARYASSPERCLLAARILPSASSILAAQRHLSRSSESAPLIRGESAGLVCWRLGPAAQAELIAATSFSLLLAAQRAARTRCRGQVGHTPDSGVGSHLRDRRAQPGRGKGSPSRFRGKVTESITGDVGPSSTGDAWPTSPRMGGNVRPGCPRGPSLATGGGSRPRCRRGRVVVDRACTSAEASSGTGSWRAQPRSPSYVRPQRALPPADLRPGPVRRTLKKWLTRQSRVHDPAHGVHVRGFSSSGQLLRDLTLDPTRDDQEQARK